MIVAMKHEKRRFVENVDFVTSPGFCAAARRGATAASPQAACIRVVTDLGIFGFDDETQRMNIVALHPGVTLEQVQETPASSSPSAADRQ